ncbi:MAG: hypothetical protein IKO49_01265 [Bacilli bacterium]|nr:hypothetical protein [Clostridia bacterium]MBR4617928.1 hypothetical protein [Bacilli bacterium]
MSQFKSLVENILQEYQSQEFNINDPVKVNNSYGKITNKLGNDKVGRIIYIVSKPKIDIEEYIDANYEKTKSPKVIWDNYKVPDSYIKLATQEELDNYILQLKKDSGMYINPTLEEDTVKQGNSWTNKGKEGTHGTFKTKKQADAQRKAMFVNGYKG